jgi:hypothetical protein
MAHAKDAADTVPMNINYNTSNGYSLSPASPNIAKGGTAQIKTSSQAATICFNPPTTPFGASQSLQAHSSVDIPVGSTDYSVGYCITNYGSTCTAPPPTTGVPSGTIKVGS